MNLIIDAGNTNTKVALIQNGKVIERFQVANFSVAWLEEIVAKHPQLSAALLSNVSVPMPEIDEFLTSRVKFHALSSASKLPFTNGYATPLTLGTDRIANAAAAVTLFPGKNCLCFDLGTCVKSDFIDSFGTYHGGSISPGISLRFKAMNEYTSRLPLLSGNKFPADFLGIDTPGSMQSGVFYGILGEITGLLENYKARYTELQTIITGGDSHYFVPALKSDIFANLDFTLIGLNKILELNV